MTCNDKIRETCQVEKMGCEGCYYNKPSEEETDRKEVSDALHMLLHCALKDKEFETQKEQFKIVMDYIKSLEKERDYYNDKYKKLLK